MREIFLGFIQGVTEFLPVSSSGHLALAQYFYQGLEDSDILLDILLHLGTLFVVFIYYRKDIIAICRAALSFVGLSSSRNVFATERPEHINDEHAFLDRKMIPLIIVGTIPTGIIGVVLKSVIEDSFASLFVVGGALLVTGTMLFFADKVKGEHAKKTISYKDALIIGTVQGIAVFPGISRSGSTISVGIFLGIERTLAAKFSFILSIPAILGAVVLEGKDLLSLTQTPHLVPYFLGTLVAFITGYFAIATLIKIVVKRKLSWFSGYCWLLGLGALVYGFVM